MGWYCKKCESNESFVSLAQLEAEATVDSDGNFLDWISLDGAISSPSFGKPTHCGGCGSEDIVNIALDRDSGEEFYSEISVAIDTDDEIKGKKGAMMLRTYMEASSEGKACVDEMFIALCGYSIKTLGGFDA